MTDQEIRQFAHQFTKGLLDGDAPDMRCWMVSAPLAACFNALGINCELVEGTVAGLHHFWIEFPDGRIIDATARQFNRSNLFLKPKPPIYVTT